MPSERLFPLISPTRTVYVFVLCNWRPNCANSLRSTGPYSQILSLPRCHFLPQPSSLDCGCIRSLIILWISFSVIHSPNPSQCGCVFYFFSAWIENLNPHEECGGAPNEIKYWSIVTSRHTESTIHNTLLLLLLLLLTHQAVPQVNSPACLPRGPEICHDSINALCPSPSVSIMDVIFLSSFSYTWLMWSK